MILKTLVLTVLILYALGDTSSDVGQLFNNTKIVPDVLQTAPKEMLKLEFENGLLAGDGLEYTPTQTKDAPKLDWSSDPNKYYTLYMACPDAPDEKNPLWSEFLHWLVVNIPGKDIDNGEVYCPYLGPAAFKFGGMMRYVFLIYEQPKKLEFDEPLVNNSDWKGHPNFKIEQFSAKYQLGSPLAGNVFRAQWDESVQVLHKTLGLTLNDLIAALK